MTFKKYAKYYDTAYQNKNYQKESEFLIKAINKFSPIRVKNILSLGCGTAGHDIMMAKKGFSITGIDGSKEMIAIAKKKAKDSGIDITFKVSDVTKFQLDKKFDFAMAMFNIVGYMTENDKMEKMLKNVSKSLKGNGLFVFDCWYGPAVLKSRPENKDKKIDEGLIRKTTQKLDIEKSIIDINFNIVENGKSQVKENHKMRFWYLPELRYFLEKSGFRFVKVCNFLDLNSNISEDDWNIFVVAQKYE